jgi:hypothetical protein
VPPPEDQKDAQKPAGRVRHDSSGRAIWEWAAESGRHAIDSTSRLLKRLDMPGLTLADDEKKKQEEEEQVEAQAQAALRAAGKPVVPTFGGPRENDPAGSSKRSFNPYDTRVATRRPAQKVASKPAPKPAASAKKPGFFARLFGR